jgi:transposase
MGSMPKQINFHLTEAQRAELTKATKHDKRPEVRQRAAGICLLGRGDKPAVVAETLDVAQVTVYAWWHRYQVQGLHGLANQAKGRPETRADDAYLQALAQTLECEPSDLGYDFAIWTVERLRDHLAQQTGVHLSVGYLRRLMRDHGYVYRRPKHDLTNLQDPAAKAAATSFLDALKRGPQPARIGSSLWTK